MYKRQTQPDPNVVFLDLPIQNESNTLILKHFNTGGPFKTFFTSLIDQIRFETVSYTHLDVYKRQAWTPQILPTFSRQGELKSDIAKELGLKAGTPVCYRAGDQPNNAFSLNVNKPGEIATTAGTSGVVYGIQDNLSTDIHSRVNACLLYTSRCV